LFIQHLPRNAESSIRFEEIHFFFQKITRCTMKSLLNILFRIQPLALDVALLFLRLFIGGFMAHHGYTKVIGNQAKFANYVASIGVPLPHILGYAAIYAEFLGGIFLVLGLFHRPAALIVAITMLVATFFAHGKDILGEGEFALVYAVITLALMVLGAGRYSIDNLIFSRFFAHHNSLNVHSTLQQS